MSAIVLNLQSHSGPVSQLGIGGDSVCGGMHLVVMIGEQAPGSTVCWPVSWASDMM